MEPISHPKGTPGKSNICCVTDLALLNGRRKCIKARSLKLSLCENGRRKSKGNKGK
jgi:hypothetical protein